MPDKNTAATAPDPPQTISPEAESGTEGLRQALIDSASGGYLSERRVRTSVVGPPAVTPGPGGDCSDCSDVTYCEVRDSQKI